MTKKTVLSLLCLLSIGLSTETYAQNPPSGSSQEQQQARPMRRPRFNPQRPSVHDPVMAKEGDTYYLFATGMGISVLSSKDMKTWKHEKPVFEAAPQWAVELIPGYKGHTWAPDVIHHNGRWHLFYSCSAFGKNTSAIGHASTPTLNPEAPDYGWTDHGKVIQSVPGRDNWNAIDPNIIVDEEGTHWMNFGSFWDGIKLVRLAPDMNAPAQPEEWKTIARKRGKEMPKEEESKPGDNAIEAPFIIRHGDYYYLLVSHDYCCRGKESTYKIAVGRSKSVAGPYFDREGHRLDQGGGTILAQGNEEWAGVGHCAAYTFDGTDYLVCHGYSLPDNGRSILIVRPITWDEEGWPNVKL